MVLPQKTPSPPLHMGCFVINHVPQVSVQSPVKERTGELYLFAVPAVNHDFWASSFLHVPLEYSEVATIPKMQKPFLYTPRLPICISTRRLSPLVCGMNVSALL